MAVAVVTSTRMVLIPALLAISMVFTSFLIMLPANADDNGRVRIYKLNSKKQLVKQRWIRNSNEAGCHDLRRSRKAFRVAQTGFAWCTIYASDDCAAGSEIPAMWRGKNYRKADIDISQPQIKLLPGGEWYLHESENIRIGSYACQYDENS